MKTASPIGAFIHQWDGEEQYVDGIENKDIDIVYEEKTLSTTLIPVNTSNIPDKRTRYQNGENVVFHCAFCGNHLGIGKSSSYKDLDKEKVVCHTCNRIYEANGYIRNSNNPLWQQPNRQNR
jgi:hypothetical protein